MKRLKFKVQKVEPAARENRFVAEGAEHISVVGTSPYEGEMFVGQLVEVARNPRTGETFRVIEASED